MYDQVCGMCTSDDDTTTFSEVNVYTKFIKMKERNIFHPEILKMLCCL